MMKMSNIVSLLPLAQPNAAGGSGIEMADGGESFDGMVSSHNQEAALSGSASSVAAGLGQGGGDARASDQTGAELMVPINAVLGLGMVEPTLLASDGRIGASLEQGLAGTAGVKSGHSEQKLMNAGEINAGEINVGEINAALANPAGTKVGIDAKNAIAQQPIDAANSGAKQVAEPELAASLNVPPGHAQTRDHRPAQQAIAQDVTLSADLGPLADQAAPDRLNSAGRQNEQAASAAAIARAKLSADQRSLINPQLNNAALAADNQSRVVREQQPQLLSPVEAAKTTQNTPTQAPVVAGQTQIQPQGRQASNQQKTADNPRSGTASQAGGVVPANAVTAGSSDAPKQVIAAFQNSPQRLTGADSVTAPRNDSLAAMDVSIDLISDPALFDQTAVGELSELDTVKQTSPAERSQQPRGLPSEQILTAISQAREQGRNRISVNLHPAELGAVEISIEMATEGHFHVHVSAERAETLEMIQKDGALLEQKLADSGLDLSEGELAFSMMNENGTADGGDADRDGEKDGGRPAGERLDAGQETHDKSTTSVRGSGLLDLTV